MSTPLVWKDNATESAYEGSSAGSRKKRGTVQIPNQDQDMDINIKEGKDKSIC